VGFKPVYPDAGRCWIVLMKRLLPCLILLLLAVPAFAIAAENQKAYPNELPHFKFYVKHLAPLTPYVSDLALVVRVLGSDRGIEVGDWRITANFIGKSSSINGHAFAHDIAGRLADVEISPKRRVSMLGVKFPRAFSHSRGGVSEIDVSCEIYSDSFGLQYWIYSEDSAVGKKGDLMRIVYGPSKQVEEQIEGPP
jgi:hypothetical protein